MEDAAKLPPQPNSHTTTVVVVVSMEDPAKLPPQPNNHTTTVVDDDDEELSATVLDLTSFQLHDLESVDLSPSLTELDLSANRLSALDPRIEHLSHLKKLSLRQNLLDDAGVQPISHWDEISGLEGCDQPNDPDAQVSEWRRWGEYCSEERHSFAYPLVFIGHAYSLPQVKHAPHAPVTSRCITASVSDITNDIVGVPSSQKPHLKKVPEPSRSHYKELVLRDNRLTKIPDLSIFRRLLVFDVSFNESSLLNGLSTVSNRLKELYVSKNEVSKIEEIDHFHELQILELGSNRLRVMENLQNLTILQELWLGRNRIRAINLCGLKCIKKISLQSNRLTSIAGLEECVALEELYLSHNGIAKMEGLLEDLWLNDNQITSLEGIAEAVSGSRDKLTIIYLERNPCVTIWLFGLELV
ncbi:hypothetical protein RHMOL_Rhmol05G0040400 [Rhododendron molle]|uniref:Uncharacterized protein n=1 Tax=Rhododendron molle TaxID=49168 RepID=A0ACC0NMM7_RHOML|nr:hypothetical protein RHMOL_Rhmol05G0040400 [Rhododendron molle]